MWKSVTTFWWEISASGGEFVKINCCILEKMNNENILKNVMKYNPKTSTDLGQLSMKCLAVRTALQTDLD